MSLNLDQRNLWDEYYITWTETIIFFLHPYGHHVRRMFHSFMNIQKKKTNLNLMKN